MSATPAWLASIEALLNRNMSGTEARSLLQRLDRTSLQINIEGMMRIRAMVAASRLSLLDGNDTPSDATLSGSPLALLKLGVGRLPSGGNTSSSENTKTHNSVQIRGDAEIANLYRELLVIARPDWEEELSRWVGDIPARRISLLTAQAFDWARAAKRTFGENISEYLTEESRDLVNKVEHEEFLQGVDTLRETTDRVEARLTRLERQVQQPKSDFKSPVQGRQ